MPYHRCYYHFVWATWRREPMIIPQRAQILFRVIRTASEQLNVPLLAINAMPDHVHLAVQIPPAIALPTYIQRIKGRSAHDWNEGLAVNEPKLRWQHGYGVVTFGEGQLATIRHYIEQQQAHHRSGTCDDALEVAEDPV